MEEVTTLEEDENSETKSITLRGFHHCNQCNITFSLKKNYTRHIKYKHQNGENNIDDSNQSLAKKYNCEKCDEKFTDHKEFCIHKLLHNEKNCCTACSVTFTTNLEFKTHVNDHLKNKTYTCMRCKNSFQKIGLLIKNDAKFKCDNCYQEQIGIKVDKSNFLVCRVCQVSYASVTNLKKHMVRVHDTDHIYKCRDCEVTCSNKPDLVSHVNNIHKPKNLFEEGIQVDESSQNFVCSECDEIMPSQRNLDVHQLLHNENDFKCTVCNKEETDYKKFEKHILKHLEFYCKLCTKMFLKQSALQTHMKVHTNERPYKCDKCEKSFKQSGQLQYHMARHDGNKKSTPLSCDICNGTFTNTSTLKRHIRNFHESKAKEYACNICKESFKSKFLLCDHVNSKHSIAAAGDSVVCVICCDSFTVDEFKKHKTTHTEIFQNKHMCKVCNKCFYYKTELDLHLEFDHFTQLQCPHCVRIYPYTEFKPHVDKHKPEKCDKCGAVFYSRILFRKHLNRHNQILKIQNARKGTPQVKKPKPPPKIVIKKITRGHFTCKICSRVFKMKHFYDKHVQRRVCTKENALICHICNGIYLNKFKYKVHMLSHTEDKPLDCRFCPNFKYKFTCSVFRHFRKCHKGEAPFFCFTCNKRFHSLVMFRKHVRSEHGIKELYATTYDAKTYIKKEIDESEIRKNHVTSHENLSLKVDDKDTKIIETELKNTEQNQTYDLSHKVDLDTVKCEANSD